MTDNTRVIIFDVETDGNGTFRPPTQNVIQISWVIAELNNENEWEIIKKKNYYLKDTTTYIKYTDHGITLDKLQKDGKEPSKILKYFTKHFNICHIAIAHNIGFDIGCIKKITEPLNIRLNNNTKLIDTCRNQKIQKFVGIPNPNKKCQRRDPYKFPNLKELCEACFINIDLFKFHDSSEDVRALLECLKHLIEKEIILVEDYIEYEDEIENIENKMKTITIN